MAAAMKTVTVGLSACALDVGLASQSCHLRLWNV